MDPKTTMIGLAKEAGELIRKVNEHLAAGRWREADAAAAKAQDRLSRFQFQAREAEWVESKV